MGTTTRRTIVLIAVMFWQGGFLFYTAVVVPIAAEVLGSHTEQGWITRQVTRAMNLSGAAALAIWAWDLWATRVGRLAWGLWGLLVLSLAFLALWHLQMDALLDVEMQHIRDRPTFYAMHRVYLWTSTLQWMASVVLLFLQIGAWQREPTGEPADRAPSINKAPQGRRR